MSLIFYGLSQSSFRAILKQFLRSEDVEFEERASFIIERGFCETWQEFVALADKARMTKVVSERRMVLASLSEKAT